MSETHERLIEAVAALTTGAEWKAILELSRRLAGYSANNLFLIAAQRPDATYVAGYRAWQALGRQVRQGERGIAIVAPSTSRARVPEGPEVEESERRTEHRVVRGFRVVHVFDVSQTDGAPLPLFAPTLLEGDAPAELWERLAAKLRRDDYQLLRADCRPANATTHYLARTVVVREDLSPAAAVKSLCHEVAHMMLHDGSEYRRGRREIVEVEAESVAFLVCSAAGLSTDGYSFPYVAHWAAGDVELVRQTTERVLEGARRLLAEIGLDGADVPEPGGP